MSKMQRRNVARSTQSFNHRECHFPSSSFLSLLRILATLQQIGECSMKKKKRRAKVRLVNYSNGHVHGTISGSTEQIAEAIMAIGEALNK